MKGKHKPCKAWRVLPCRNNYIILDEATDLRWSNIGKQLLNCAYMHHKTYSTKAVFSPCFLAYGRMQNLETGLYWRTHVFASRTGISCCNFEGQVFFHTKHKRLSIIRPAEQPRAQKKNNNPSWLIAYFWVRTLELVKPWKVAAYTATARDHVPHDCCLRHKGLECQSRLYFGTATCQICTRCYEVIKKLV